ncbi:MAG: RluA family pseudouridine synthase [Planctomycetaceae bacterium]|nr:RluA family pseudouridine synthase [Planctomycetaceae bacterium]
MSAVSLDILYEEGPCLVVNKPAGLSTQAPPGIDSLEVRVKEYYRARRETQEGNVYLGVPHRLDRPVSGAIVFARHVRAARRLSEQFENRLVRKIYWVCVEGLVAPGAGTWRDTLRKIPGEPRAEVVAADHAEGRPAVLHYRTLGSTDWGSWLEVELETGRMHQVRIQAASRGWPVVGDTHYHATTTFGPLIEDPRGRAIALHARALEFRHPMTREEVKVVAPVNSSWSNLLPTGLSEI